MAHEALVLAIDTASPLSAVALWARGEIHEEELPADRRASEDLLPAVRRCLSRAGVTLDAISRLALCAGPGSFTGLRVGLATAWGLSRAAGVPVETVSTLGAMAEASRENGIVTVCTALDAGRGEVVLERFDLSAPRAVSLGPALLRSLGEAAAAAMGSPLRAIPRDLLESHAPRLSQSPARALALAVARCPGPDAAVPMTPIYSRPSAAEEKHGAA